MLNLSGIAKSYGGKTLFRDLSLQVNASDRIGIVGPNGAGKSTLFGLILGEESPDAGVINRPKRIRLGHLPQESLPAGNASILQLACSVDGEITELMEQLRSRAGSEAAAAAQPEGGPLESDAHARYHELGGHALEARAKQILAGLGFRQSDFDRPCVQMSGGWVMRAHLARLLVLEPEVLMLDEPTNHLDLDAVLWLQGYLGQYPGALLMVSHDRAFLNTLVDSIVEIQMGRSRRYPGNFDQYLRQREADATQHRQAYQQQQKEIHRTLAFVERFRAKATKARQVQSRLKQLDKMERLEAPDGSERRVHFQFPQPPRSGRWVVRLEEVHHAYGDVVVYPGNLNLEVERHDRIVLVGPNGAGKSTLLKLLAGVLPIQHGRRHLGYHVQCGYFSQHRTDMLDTNRTVLEEALDSDRSFTEEYARTILGSFLFQGDDVFKRVSVLSGGEKSRLALVKILLNPPNFLLMDEPTTHLDLTSIDALVGALDQFQGTLVFISHDVHFIRSIARSVIEVNEGRIRRYAGDYDYYCEKKAAAAPPALPSAPPSTASRKSKNRKRREAEARQERSRRRRAQEQIVTKLERQIAAAEKRREEITRELENPETYASPARLEALNREMQSILGHLEDLSTAWETEAERLEAIHAEHPRRTTP